MLELDRLRMVELLGRLGAEPDSAALEAARELDRMVRASGSSWDDVLRRDLRATAGDGAGVSEVEGAGEGEPRSGAVSAAEMAEASALINRLLARKNLSSATSEDLADMQRSIAEGTFDVMDSRYIRALARRLGV
jgi:hypothetical protein